MSVVSASVRPAPRPRRLVGPLLWSGVLLVAVVLVPFRMASAWPGGGFSDRSALVDSLAAAVVRYWDAGSGATGAELALPVSFWARFHVVKAVLAAALFVVAMVLGARTLTAYAGATSLARRVGLGALAVASGAVALLALVVSVANVQGAIAPLSSALGLLPLRAPDPALGQTIEQVRQGLANGAPDPALAALVHDFAVYHAAMAGLGALVTVGLLVGAVRLWRSRARMSGLSRRGRGLLTLAIGAALATAAFFGVVTAANLSTVAHPAPALLAFFDGGR